MNIAFEPSNSPHYKVISICRAHKTLLLLHSDLHKFIRDRVLVSLRSRFPRASDHVDFSNGVFLHGSIHWPSNTEETSYRFDVENEAFKVMPMPPVQDGQTRRTIRFFRECGGRLLMIDFHEPFTTKFDVFGLESDYSGWGVEYSVDFSRFGRLFTGRFYVLSVICGDDEEDLSLVVYLPGRDCAGKGLMTYGLKEGVLRKVHPPVPGWDLRMLEQKGASAVHPLIRTRYAV